MSSHPLKDHIPGLDGLRGIAVLLVLWSHLPTGGEGSLLGGLKRLALPGYLGVDIFFVLSGFLITRILVADRASGHPLRHFFVRRFLRIFPIYYLLIGILLVLQPGAYLAWCAAYLSNFAFVFDSLPNPMRHTWSLSVEEHFYLVWPLLIYAFPPQQSRRLALYGVIPLAVASAVITLIALPDKAIAAGLIDRGSFYRVASLALGASIAYSESRLRARPATCLKLSIPMLATGVGILLVARFGLREWFPVGRLIGFSLASGAIVLACIGLHGSASLPARALRSRLLRGVGRISYGLYLYHYPIYSAFGLHSAEEPASPYALPLGLGLTFAAATASYALFEKRILMRKEQVCRWVTPRSFAVTSPP
ncbi:MAG: acyltransferase family protein [Planctomycetota bacterium]